MKDLDKIRAITDANIRLDIADRDVLDCLKAQNPTYVYPKQLKSSKGILISEDFAVCQAICFLDTEREVGALAHNYSSHDPYYFLTGEWKYSNEPVENPLEIFDCMSKVVAVHVYHISGYNWSEKKISGALRKIGIESIVHIPIKPKEPGEFSWRHIAQDVKDGSLYIFPADFFEYGIRFSPDYMFHN